MQSKTITHIHRIGLPLLALSKEQIVQVGLAIAIFFPAGNAIAEGFTPWGYSARQSTSPALADEMLSVSDAPIQKGEEVAGYPVTSGYGWRGDIGIPGASADHKGVDFATPSGTPLHMVGESGGTVECWQDNGGGGTVANITLTTGDYNFQALHLSGCHSGQFNAGEVFAYTGDTGIGAEHLDFRQFDKNAVNPSHELGTHVHPARGWAEWLLTGKAPINPGIAVGGILEGGTDSLAAIAIGNAEGTRNPDGSKTPLYQGHTDPGNSASNSGTFSWQAGGCSTPEECDQRGLERLQGALNDLSGMQGGDRVAADPEALINYLDLMIQAPLAAEAFPSLYARTGDILKARVESFRNPATGQFETTLTGDGINTLDGDQRRRMDAIKEVLVRHGNVTVRPQVQPQPTATTDQAMAYFQEIANGSEFGGGSGVRRWQQDVIGFQVQGQPNQNDLATLRQVQSELTALTGIRFEQSDNPDMLIRFIPEEQFASVEPNYVPRNLGFFWVQLAEDAITNARILISTTGITQEERNHLIREEVTQAMGLMNDSPRHADSIFHSEWSSTAKVQGYSELDKAVIRMLYGR
ncbi:MAG: DUF2927 domain-containing protein [Cyanobacteria bacterium J06638_20]